MNLPENYELSKNNKRLVGLDILKILSMAFIIIFHVSKHGYYYDNVSVMGGGKAVLIILNALFLPSVNIFVYVSSYLIVRKGKVSIKHYISLYAQIVFYSLLFFIYSCAVKINNFSIVNLIKCFMPITFSNFWFCKEYLLLYIISPILLKIVQNLNKKEYTITIFVILGLLLYCNIFKNISIIPLNSGFSVVWFILLFLLAGYQFRFGFNSSKLLNIIVFIISFVLSILMIRVKGINANYTNFITVIQTIALFNLLYDVNIKSEKFKKILTYISTCTLGIYMLHDGNIIRRYLYDNIFKTYLYFGSNALLYFFLFVFIIFIAGLVVETIRKAVVKLIKHLWKNATKKEDIKSIA